ncbi:MAG TPA: hypothetical protein VFI18_05595 [Gaiellales bacterium]|nr:hypothetical protein [Gaiellales bacterium]
MAERADAGQEPILHDVHRPAAGEALDERLVGRACGRDERLGGQDPGGQRLLDDVLALGQELAQLAAATRGQQPARVLQTGVLA